MPAALLARFGRATAEQVVQHIEERMAAPRERGFRARFAGREFQPGMERDFALGFLSQLGNGMGAGMGGAPMSGAPMATGMGGTPMAMSAHTAGAGVGTSGAGHGRHGRCNEHDGLAGHDGPCAGGGAAMTGYGPSADMHGGGLLGSFLPGGDMLSSSEFELNREQHGGILSVWSRSSRSYFQGMENALSLNGDVRTTMLGADYRRGPLTVGLSVGRTMGLGGYTGPSGGQMTTSMTGFYPWLGYQVNDKVSVWGATGYGTGALSLTPDRAAALDTGMSMAMMAGGTRGELVGSRATGGFALAFKADALWVGASTEQVEGAAGRLNASEAGVTRLRTALEGSRGFTLGGRLSLTPSVEVGLRQDGGDAETGTGMDVGGGLAFTDTVTGLLLDVQVRTLVVHQAEGFSERGMSLSFGWDPTPSSPFGLTARIAPSWGGQATGGAEALWQSQMAYGMSYSPAGGVGRWSRSSVSRRWSTLPNSISTARRRASKPSRRAFTSLRSARTSPTIVTTTAITATADAKIAVTIATPVPTIHFASLIIRHSLPRGSVMWIRRASHGILLLAILAGHLLAGVGRAQPADEREAATAAHLERIREDPTALAELLADMPVGADLHHHLTGGVRPPELIRMAAADGPVPAGGPERGLVPDGAPVRPGPAPGGRGAGGHRVPSRDRAAVVDAGLPRGR